MAMIKIDNVALPSPVSYKVTQSDLVSENSTRNGAGFMLLDPIRKGLYRIDVGWIITKPEYEVIVKAISRKEFEVTFYDPNISSTTTTTTMYVNDRVGELISMENSLWKLTCALIEK